MLEIMFITRLIIDLNIKIPTAPARVPDLFVHIRAARERMFWGLRLPLAHFNISYSWQIYILTIEEIIIQHFLFINEI